MVLEMIKYPEIYTPNILASIITRIPDILDLTGYIQPKYDGSNITCFSGTCATRFLNPLPKYYLDGLRTALKDGNNKLMNLSYKYQVFLELGGRKNSPAGYVNPWSGDWDYRVIDLFIGRFLEPVKISEILSEYNLKYVGFEVAKVGYVVNNWRRILSERYAVFEGFVLKIFPEGKILRRLKDHIQRNVIMVKFKHEYNTTRQVKKLKKKEKEEWEPATMRELPPSEIRGVINKAHMALGDEIFNKRKAMPLIFKLAKEEARKHGNKAPPAKILFKYYEEYIRNLNTSHR